MLNRSGFKMDLCSYLKEIYGVGYSCTGFNGSETWLKSNSNIAWTALYAISLTWHQEVSTTFIFLQNFRLPDQVSPWRMPDYSRNEYLNVTHVQEYNVLRTLAVPVFELMLKRVLQLAIMELMTTIEKISLNKDIDNVCQALQVCKFLPVLMEVFR